MEVIVRPDADAAATLAARLIADRVRAKPDLVLGLATGRTMERVYQRLAAAGLDFSRCRSFNLDEYIGIPAQDARSYRAYMDAHLFRHINIDRANTHVLDGMAAILAKAVEGPITAMISASALQLHPRCKVVLDEAAAGALTQRAYYDWVFQNEPEWAGYR